MLSDSCSVLGLSRVCLFTYTDYWHCGYKKERPYVVSYNGKYHGRFATMEQAAVQFARLDMGLPPLEIQKGGATGGSSGGGKGGGEAGSSSAEAAGDGASSSQP